MNNKYQKVLHFFNIKIIVGILVVGGAVALVEWIGRAILDRTSLPVETKEFIIAIPVCTIALVCYVLLFRAYEKRSITELSFERFGKDALSGFVTGFLLQSLPVAIIYLYGGYKIEQINSISSLLPAFNAAIVAGFVAETIIIGIIFRLTEERTGTTIALIILTLLFAFMHINVKGATIISVLSTAIQAGLLLSAAYVFTRSLWFVIFFHFAWDLTEPGIYGGINPGNSIESSLLTSKISGTDLLTGGILGPQNSIQSLLFCLVASFIFILLAKKKNNWIKPRKVM
jgi:membrane protease YdiL (CAAX protease family)